MILRFIALASLALNCFFVFVFTETANFYLTRIPFDMQEVRSDYLKDVNMFFNQACLEGADYPPEYRINPGKGYNENSPANWCINRKKTSYEDWFQRSSESLGRRGPKWM